jgi:medium-chain acyl-[acyl-carrier-protein] hydrolase
MEVLDEAGNLLLRTVSLWVLMDLQTRTMLLPGKSGVTVSGMVTGTELSAPRGLPAQAGENRQDHRVVFSDLDRNGHVNNTRYLDWAGDLLTADFHSGHTLREMMVCYMTESREGQTLQLQWGLADQILGVDALRDGERIFAARLHYEAV